MHNTCLTHPGPLLWPPFVNPLPQFQSLMTLMHACSLDLFFFGLSYMNTLYLQYFHSFLSLSNFYLPNPFNFIVSLIIITIKHMYSHMHSHAHIHMCTCVHTHAHTCAHRHTCVYTCVHILYTKSI